MWPFKHLRWTAKMRQFRRDCREEEKAVERLINWGATTPAPPPIQKPVGASTPVSEVLEAAKNLTKVKGRFHTQQAYERLDKAVKNLDKTS